MLGLSSFEVLAVSGADIVGVRFLRLENSNVEVFARVVGVPLFEELFGCGQNTTKVVRHWCLLKAG